MNMKVPNEEKNSRALDRRISQIMKHIWPYFVFHSACTKADV